MYESNRRGFLLQGASALFEEKKPESRDIADEYANKAIPDLEPSATGLANYAGPWTDTQVAHLLRRTLFAFSHSDLEFFKAMTMSQAVDYLLNLPANAPAPPLNNYNTQVNDPDVPAGQTWVNAPFGDGSTNTPRNLSLKSWWIGLQLEQERNIREKMTLFWHNHFATEQSTINDARYAYKHHALLRQYALGNFKDLVREVTIDPAMLRYLNGNVNSKAAPDENYARELQELFTIGKDLPNHYTEDDVKQAARVLTGWRDSRTGISSSFDPTRHDTGNKQFSSFYNNTLITGRSGSAAGMDELNDLLNMIFAQQEVARYICRKLYRFFVYYVIDSNVEQNVIVPLADIFRQNNYDIKPVMEALLKSEHFYDSLSMGCSIKSPVDFTVGMMRTFNVALPPASNITQQYGIWYLLWGFCATQQQDLGEPPNVAGWPAYYQVPQYYELWINSDTLPKRNQVSDLMIYTGIVRNGFKLIFDPIAFAQQFSGVSDPNQLIGDILKLL